MESEDCIETVEVGRDLVDNSLGALMILTSIGEKKKKQEY